VASFLANLASGLDPGEMGARILCAGSSEHRPFVPQDKHECLCHLGVIRFVCWFDILSADFGEGLR
jgi:hypothetical protein